MQILSSFSFDRLIQISVFENCHHQIMCNVLDKVDILCHRYVLHFTLSKENFLKKNIGHYAMRFQ